MSFVCGLDRCLIPKTLVTVISSIMTRLDMRMGNGTPNQSSPYISMNSIRMSLARSGLATSICPMATAASSKAHQRGDVPRIRIGAGVTVILASFHFSFHSCSASTLASLNVYQSRSPLR